jgi:Kef-type K+ transport system membrane component KefB
LSNLQSVSIKPALVYIILLVICGAGIWFILRTGSALYENRALPASATAPSVSQAQSSEGSPSGPGGISKLLSANLRNALSILLLQLVVIIIASRIVGKLFLKIGQPRVMGEIVAGIILGPSLLGQLSPGAMAFLFPAASLEPLRLLSQIGVVLFMFVVGMQLEIGDLRRKAYAAVMVSHASIVVPFFLGVNLALLLYNSQSPAQTSFTPFALFMGIAMSITAFPVLARILEDRGLSKTTLGGIAITCAAVDDVTAWCLLALVIAIARADGVRSAILTIGFVVAFIAIMIFLIKPALARLIKVTSDTDQGRRALVAMILAFVLASALFTEVVGIHALFGGFLAGVIMPATAGVRRMLKEKLETFSLVVLLPLFFAFTGLRMQITLLNDWNSWLLCGLIILVAIAGKLGGSMFMARWAGMGWRDSFSLGVLLNTRGLVELIVLSIGFDLGILSARTFAMLVLMALVTTFMTGPLLSLVKFGGSEPMTDKL